MTTDKPMNDHMTDLRAALTGMITSLFGGGVLDIIADAGTALLFGLLGAVGGFLGKELMIWIKSKFKR